jgi:hypothetical protein
MLRTLRRAAVLLALSLVVPAAHGLAAAAAPAVASDPYDLRFEFAWQVERFHAPEADSLGHSVTTGTATRLGFDFRVVDLPVPGAGPKPALHVVGHTRSSGRTFATGGLARAGGAAPAIDEMPVFEIGGAAVLRVPVTMIAPGAGADFFAGYEGGLVLASDTGYDFMHVKRAVFGFERTRGFFEGSLVEMAYGRNETFGLEHAAGRWATRFRVRSRLGPEPKPAADGQASGSPVCLFVDLLVDTDGGTGPDGIQGLAGLTLDAGAVLRRVMGSPE